MDVGIPRPPTDSLYKFLALGGVLVTAVSVFVPDELAGRLEVRERDISTELAVIGVQQAALKRRERKILEIMDNSIAMQRGTYRPNPARLEMHFSEDELKQMVDRHADLIEQDGIALEKTRGLIEQNNLLRGRVQRLQHFGAFGSWGGAFVSLVGFGLWYFRIQRYEDRIARGRARDG